MILFTITLIWALYNAQLLWSSYSSVSSQALVLLLCNVGSSMLLVIAASYYVYITQALKNSKIMEDEDYVLNSLERKTYNAAYCTITAFIMAFLTMSTGFMYLRDSNPNIILNSFIIVFIALFFFVPNMKINSLIFPNFQLPDPNSKNTVSDTLDYYDDGQKHLLLKSLYKLFFIVIGLLVCLVLALMYYSIFSGNNQTVSIIGIGLILLLSLIIFTSSLKPGKMHKH